MAYEDGSIKRYKVEERSFMYVKQALTMNGYSEWLIKRYIQLTFFSKHNFCLFNNFCDQGRETKIETKHKNVTSKKYPVVLPYIQGVQNKPGVF